VLAAIEAAGCTPANNNGSGQIVAAGTAEQIAALTTNPPKGARIVPLSVAGAFHTEHMRPGQDRLARLAPAITTHEPRVTLLSNADGAPVASGREFLGRLVAQITLPVRWDLCMQTMTQMGVTGLLELPPSGTLTGIAKRNMTGVEVFALNTPDQLAEARAFVERHSDIEAHHDRLPNVPWMMATSPAKGELEISEGCAQDAEVPAGAVVGRVSNTLGAHEVVAEHGGRVVEWLVETGDIVRPGQPLVRLHPSTEDTL